MAAVEDLFVAVAGSDPVVQGLLGGVVIAFLNLLGAMLVLVWRNPSQRSLDGALGFAAGVMLAASFTSLIVPGIDFAFLGPVDLSVSMGYPMAPDEPAVQRAIERVRAACSDADVPIGEMVSDTGSIERVIEDGTRILRLADDVRAVRETVAAQLDVARDTTG